MKSLKYSGMGNGAVNNFNIFSRFRYMNVFLPFELFIRILAMCITLAFLLPMFRPYGTYANFSQRRKAAKG